MNVSKTMVLISFLLCTTVLWSQDEKGGSKVAFNVEYGIAITGINNGNDLLFPSHNLFARFRYKAGSLVTPTIGIGVMTAGSSLKAEGTSRWDRHYFHYTNNVKYLVVPIGLNLKLRKVDITIEGSLAFLLKSEDRFRSKSYHLSELPELVLSGESDITTEIESAEKITNPIILTATHAMTISNFKFNMGCKLFYSLDDVSDLIGNYYGASLTIGKEF